MYRLFVMGRGRWGELCTLIGKADDVTCANVDRAEFFRRPSVVLSTISF